MNIDSIIKKLQELKPILGNQDINKIMPLESGGLYIDVADDIQLGQRVGITDMGFMGLETYYGEVIEIPNPHFIKVDFGKTYIEQRFQTVSRKRIKK